jgi:hypothetical protein
MVRCPLDIVSIRQASVFAMVGTAKVLRRTFFFLSQQTLLNYLQKILSSLFLDSNPILHAFRMDACRLTTRTAADTLGLYP